MNSRRFWIRADFTCLPLVIRVKMKSDDFASNNVNSAPKTFGRSPACPARSAQIVGGFRTHHLRKNHRRHSVAEPIPATPHQRSLVCVAATAVTTHCFDG